MVYCNNCGEQLKKDQTFCTGCGATVKQREPEPTKPQRSVNKASSSILKSKKSKILALSVLLLALIGFGGYKTAQAMNKPIKVVTKFEQAVQNKDEKALTNLLNKGQDEMVVEESESKMLLDYFHNNPDLLAETKDNLRREAQSLENDSLMSTKTKGIFTLVESKKKWGVISQYGVSFQPVYFRVTANQSDASIIIDGKDRGKLKEEDERTIGPLLPIEHELKGSFKGEYATVTDKQKVDPKDYEGNKIDVEFDLSGEQVDLYSNYDEATVFINGKSTGKSVRELGTIGPVSLDGSIKVHAELKMQGKKLTSEAIPVTDNSDSLDLTIDDTVIQEAEARKAEAAAAAEERAVQAAAEVETAKSDIEDVIYSHYNDISSGFYSDAYELFSSGRKAKVGYTNWEKGYKNNLSDEVKYVVVDDVKGDKATASFEMVSRDSKPNGDTLVQTWGGKWHLVKEPSGWKLSEADIKKLQARTE
ncbi:TcaA 3rd/4th domain-containing protein [Peribacillus glennii]|nr:zinc-ribbon domain-containing protein [Peribacillus glennii]